MSATLESSLVLSDEELAFFRLTCELFTTPESPLRYLDEEAREPADIEQTYAALTDKKLMRDDGIGAVPELLSRLSVVGECGARVSVKARGRRDFYIAESASVEYNRANDAHTFGPVQSEFALAQVLARQFITQPSPKTQALRLSAGDYLVFAVFARDVRAAPAEAPFDDTMSLEEVLAYFDEPETKYVRTPSDDSWQQSVNALAGAGVLVSKKGGWELHASYHALARELAAEAQQTVMRFDFLDEQWLVREVNLYPTKDATFRLGTQSDGSVLIQELSTDELGKQLLSVVGTLPAL